MAGVRIKITGKVQGVFFRHTTRQQAKVLRLRGWVKNLPDGSVLCEAIGPEKSLLDLIAWCKQGPPRAQVINTAVEWLDENEENLGSNPTDFQIID